jgi:hypothetical protein
VDTFFVGQVGGNNTIDGLEFDFNWQLKHELNHRVAFGLEGFSAIQDLSQLSSFNQQLHRAGPVIYFDFGGSTEESVIEIHTDHGRPSSALDVKIAGGLLFGMTDATSDITYKLDAEVAF